MYSPLHGTAEEQHCFLLLLLLTEHIAYYVIHEVFDCSYSQDQE